MSLEGQVDHGFTHLPAGCTIMMERVARQSDDGEHSPEPTQSQSRLVGALGELGRDARADLRACPSSWSGPGLEPDDLYRRGRLVAAWSSDAGLREPFHDPDEERLTKGLRRVAHVNDADDDPPPLGPARARSTPRSTLALDPMDDRRLLMLDFGSGHGPASRLPRPRASDGSTPIRRSATSFASCWPTSSSASTPWPRPCLPFACPLTLHASYTRDELLTALGHWTRTEQPEMREGVLHLPEIRADVFFVTLQKTEKDYSPTTMYQDYAINERLFHWQSQSTTSADSPTGRRYVEHVDGATPFCCLAASTRTATDWLSLSPSSARRVRQPQRQPADEHHLAAGAPVARAAVPQAGPACRGLNELARSREGEAPSEPAPEWARTEPRPPRIRQSYGPATASEQRGANP